MRRGNWYLPSTIRVTAYEQSKPGPEATSLYDIGYRELLVNRQQRNKDCNACGRSQSSHGCELSDLARRAQAHFHNYGNARPSNTPSTRERPSPARPQNNHRRRRPTDMEYRTSSHRSTYELPDHWQEKSLIHRHLASSGR